ncbi:MAG: FecR domain-containing protein [Paracoccaceae bacterium]
MLVLSRTVAGVFLSGLLWFGASATAQVVGKVTNIAQGATATSGGTTTTLALKSNISTGDLLKTNTTGQLQIVFVDRTRIVVGPSSELLIEDITLSGTKKASKFAIQALGGTFRFLSGRSPKAVYDLRTPTATMGIRGTEFDFAIGNRRLTKLVAFSGQVRICTRNNRCARISGGCSVVTATRRRIKLPRNDDVRNSILREDFPYVVSQDALDKDYRVQVERCGEIGTKVVTKKSTLSIERKGEASKPSAAEESGAKGGSSKSSGSNNTNGNNNSGGGYNEAADES